MDDASLLAEIAHEIETLIDAFTTLVGDVQSPTDVQRLSALLEELTLMETIFPEFAKASSPTNTIEVLMEHLGNGVLHTRYPHFASVPDVRALHTVLGDEPGVVVYAEPALIDVYYVNNVLVKAHLRDGVWTDVLAYCVPLGLPPTIKLEKHSKPLTFWATMSLRPHGDDVPSRLCRQGKTLEALQLLVPNTDAAGPAALYIPVDLQLVDCSLRDQVNQAAGIGYVMGDLAECLGVIFAATHYTGTADLQTKLWDDPSPYFSSVAHDVRRAGVVFIHANNGSSVVTLPSRDLIQHGVVKDFTPQITLEGQIEYELVLDPITPGVTTANPSDTKCRVSSRTDATIYGIGDRVSFSAIYYPVSSFRLLAPCGMQSRRIQYETCPFCNRPTLATSKHRLNVVCTNQRCPGLVAERFRSFVTEPWSGFCFLPPYSDPIMALRLVTDINSECGPVTFPQLLQHVSRYLSMPNLFPTGEHVGLREIYDGVLDKIASEPLSSECWKYTYQLLYAMGLTQLPNYSLRNIARFVQEQLRPPFPYLSTVLSTPHHLVRAGIAEDLAIRIALEVRSRYDEFVALNELFSLVKTTNDIERQQDKDQLERIITQANAIAERNKTINELVSQIEPTNEAATPSEPSTHPVDRIVDAATELGFDVTQGVTITVI